MKLNCLFAGATSVALITSLSIHSSIGQPAQSTPIVGDLTKTILHYDSMFWSAYNQCDVDKMSLFFTDDLEFYHDKNGLTSPKSKLEEITRTGLCGNSNWHLRREAIEGTVKVFPMNNYGALISGEHLFYINEPGKAEYLDGYGKFTHLWIFKDGTWKMSRVISYDHGPPPFVNNRTKVVLVESELRRLAGNYGSSQMKSATVIAKANGITLTTGTFEILLLPESNTRFFAEDRDLQVHFILKGGSVEKTVVYEKGNAVDELKRM